MSNESFEHALSRTVLKQNERIIDQIRSMKKIQRDMEHRVDALEAIDCPKCGSRVPPTPPDFIVPDPMSPNEVKLEAALRTIITLVNQGAEGCNISVTRVAWNALHPTRVTVNPTGSSE